MTRNRKVGRFRVHTLDDYIILGFSKEWGKYFKEKPFFDVEVDNNCRLILKGPKIRMLNDE